MKFLEEDNCTLSLHALVQESNIFFNMKHFEKTIINGEWEVAEKYLSAFTNIDDNRYSKKLFYELRKQKYYEAFHSLEIESKVFFDVHCFEEYVVSDEWDKVEKYLSAFTKIDDNLYSTKMFWELQGHLHR
ncbi:hypothetical protein WN943_006780 [Citrus x changshan-huyou]